MTGAGFSIGEIEIVVSKTGDLGDDRFDILRFAQKVFRPDGQGDMAPPVGKIDDPAVVDRAGDRSCLVRNHGPRGKRSRNPGLARLTIPHDPEDQVAGRRIDDLFAENLR